MAYTAPTRVIGQAGLTADLNLVYQEVQRLGNAVRYVYLSQNGIGSDSVLTMGSTTYGNDQTAALQTILNRAASASLHIVWDVACSHTGLRIRSNTSIFALPGCGAILLPGGVAPLFENYNLVQNGARIDANISISGPGSIWNGNGVTMGGTQIRPKGNGTQGLACAMRFYGVENLSVKDITVLRPRTYAIHALNIGRGLYQGVKVDVGPGAINMDGLHFDGNCNDCIIRDVDLTTFDDGVGCNADDIYLSTGYADGLCGSYYANAAGPAVRLLFENIRLHNSLFGVRVLSGGSRVDEITIRGVSGTTSYYGLVIDNYRQNPGGLSVPGPGNIGRVVVENYSVLSSGAQNLAMDQLACINVNAQIDTLIFRNTRRSDFTFNGFPTFRLTGSGNIRHLIFEGYECLDGSSMVTDHIILDGPFIATVTLQAVNVDRTTGANASSLLKIVSGTVNAVQLTNVNVNGLDSIVTNVGGILNYIHAAGIRHAVSSTYQGAASFKSVSGVNDIVLSNYYGPAQIFPTGTGTFPVQRGDGFGTTQSGGGATTVVSVFVNDSFTDPALANWVKFGTPSTITANSTATGKLSISPLVGVVGQAFNGIITTARATIIGRRFSTLISQPLNQTENHNDTAMALQSGSTTNGNSGLIQVRWIIEAGNLLAQDSGNVVGTTAIYDPVAHKYLALRVTAGVLYYETSADGITWSVFTNRLLANLAAQGFDATSVALVLFAGTWSASNSTGTAIFDNAKLASI